MSLQQIDDSILWDFKVTNDNIFHKPHELDVRFIHYCV